MTVAQILETRGTVGIHAEPRSVNLHTFFWRELELLGARLYTRDDVERAVTLVERGDLPVGGLISRVVPMAEAKAAFDAMAAGGGVLKVLVDVQSGADR